MNTCNSINSIRLAIVLERFKLTPKNKEEQSKDLKNVIRIGLASKYLREN